MTEFSYMSRSGQCATCSSCGRPITKGMVYGAHGLCSECLETEVRGDGIGGE